jgi:hypothetical protein
MSTCCPFTNSMVVLDPATRLVLKRASPPAGAVPLPVWSVPPTRQVKSTGKGFGL